MNLVAEMNSMVGRGVRVVLGLVLVVLGLVVGGGGGLALAIVGLVPLAAGAFGVCLAAPLFRAPFAARR